MNVNAVNVSNPAHAACIDAPFFNATYIDAVPPLK